MGGRLLRAELQRESVFSSTSFVKQFRQTLIRGIASYFAVVPVPARYLARMAANLRIRSKSLLQLPLIHLVSRHGLRLATSTSPSGSDDSPEPCLIERTHTIGVGHDFKSARCKAWTFEHANILHLENSEKKIYGRSYSTGPPQAGKLVIYRLGWIRSFRLVVRLKLIQLGSVAAVAYPLANYAQQGIPSLATTLGVAAVVGGAGAASTALWYYSRRLVGEMALLPPDLQVVQISVVDFWGNRENVQCNIRDIVPPLKGMTKKELEKAAQQILIHLDVLGDRQFLLSLRHGNLVEKDILFALLNGSFEIPDTKT